MSAPPIAIANMMPQAAEVPVAHSSKNKPKNPPWNVEVTEIADKNNVPAMRERETRFRFDGIFGAELILP